MNSIVLVAIFTAVAFAAPQAPTEQIPIIRQDSELNPDSSYQYSYEAGNGISTDQKGDLKNVGDVEALEVQDQFKNPGANGDHLPTAPSESEAIQRSLAYLATPPPADSLQ